MAVKKYDPVRAIRVSDKEWELWKGAAERAGYGAVSQWIRRKLNDAARLGR